MPIHDWTVVEAGIYHHFHHRWITALSDALNAGLMPPEYYALAEQQAGGFGPDVLTLQSISPVPSEETAEAGQPTNGSPAVLLAPPRTRFAAESAREFYLRKTSTIAIRHISADQIVAVVEIISPSNKSSRGHFKALVDKVIELLDHRIHLLIVDLFPPTKRDPSGLHAALWEEIADVPFAPPADKPLTAVAYEAAETVRAFIEPLAVGDALPDMPLFLAPGAHVLAPLESTYQSAFGAVPLRWRRELEAQ